MALSEMGTAGSWGVSRRWWRHPEVLWRRNGSRVVVLAPGQDQPSVLEGTAAVVWDLLESPIDESELVRIIAEVFEASTERVTGDLQPFLTSLSDGRLVVDA